ncbi:MAG: NAD(P)-dependent oxidoreductase [Candidatus Heimdallarchaeota archaeon]|nr:NAD(P)-dependent oxidoreductase [Candidatus Heimdallarchaeota archaeon]
MSTIKTIFITGATGTMGLETLKQFTKRSDKFKLKLLIHDTKQDRKIISPYEKLDQFEIFYGNLKDSRLLEKCITGVDFVIHIGALVSPMADTMPEETLKVNYGSTLSIIEAIKKQENADDIALVYIGTVGQTGCRRDPIHWGRVGDPMKGSMFDYYSTSKIASERAVIESGLKKWVCLRQSGMLPFISKPYSIVFHQNLNNVLEWSTAKESGLLMANVCEDWIPDSFWRKVYNIGGGEKWRMTNWQFLELYYKIMRRDYKQIYDPQDLAIYNFHGQWYTDSDVLDEIAKFRFLDPQEYFEEELKDVIKIRSIPVLNKLIPSEKKLRKMIYDTIDLHGGTRWMVDNNMEDWIIAFFGSREEKDAITTWEEGYELYDPSREPSYLDHGYDESKPTEELDIDDIYNAAAFRGGQCLSASMTQGDIYSPLVWQCHRNHKFEATPFLILKAGHWCPECERSAWDYADYAKHSPFFAQVWTPLHYDQHVVKVEKEFSDKTIN